jgi:hypothetical protein
MDELYAIIGRLYSDLVQAQKYISLLQGDINDKEKIIAELRTSIKEINDRQ